MWVCEYVNESLYVCVSMCRYLCICECVHVSVCMWVFEYVNVSLCVYMCVCVWRLKSAIIIISFPSSSPCSCSSPAGEGGPLEGQISITEQPFVATGVCPQPQAAAFERWRVWSACHWALRELPLWVITRSSGVDPDGLIFSPSTHRHPQKQSPPLLPPFLFRTETFFPLLSSPRGRKWGWLSLALSPIT